LPSKYGERWSHTSADVTVEWAPVASPGFVEARIGGKDAAVRQLWLIEASSR